MAVWQIPAEKANEFRLVRRRTRTGFVGLGQSGKTTLMTALIDRVRKTDGRVESRTLGKVRHRTGRLPPRPPDPEAFTYDNYCESLSLPYQAWPKKTRVATRCAYLHYVEGTNVLNSLYANNVAEEHVLLDIPGERLADFGMAGRKFEVWSDTLLDEVADRPEFYTRAVAYFDLIEKPEAKANDVVRCYKEVLAEFAHAAIPLITPSSFLIHPPDYPKSERDAAPHLLTKEALVQRGIVGVTASAQFAPLTGKARTANPQLVEPFARHYDAYRESVGEAMAKDFYACDNLVLLIDVAAVLEGGPKTFYATRNCVKRLLQVLDPGLSGEELFKDIVINLITAGRGGVEKIDRLAFVATKADVIHSQHRHRLLDLLKEITEDLLPADSAQRWMARRSFVVAAVQAAEDADPPRVKGFIRSARGELSPTSVVLPYPRELPTAWPPESTWKDTEYAFGGFAPPPLDKNGTEFWPGFGMEALVEYLGLLSV